MTSGDAERNAKDFLSLSRESRKRIVVFGDRKALMLALEAKRGWELVHVFQGKDCTPTKTPDQFPNWTVLKRPAPGFYTAENPWSVKGPMPWLPDLDAKVPHELVPQMEESGGHGSPCIARRYRCLCGEEIFHIRYSHEMGRVEALCVTCNRRQILVDNETVSTMHGEPQTPRRVPDNSLSTHKCKCGTEFLSPFLALEYSVDSEEGWDFTWLNIVAKCPKCARSEYIWEIEAQ